MIKSLTAVAAICAVTAAARPAAGGESVVMQRSNLRAQAARTSERVEVLGVGQIVTVVSPTPMNGYVKVTTSAVGRGPSHDGWILAKNLEDEIVVAGMESDE